MALNNEDKKDVQKHMGKALANKVSKVTKDGSGRTQEIANQIKAKANKSSGQVTKDGSTKLSRNTARLAAEGKLYKSTGMAPDSPFRNVTHIGKKKIR